MPFHFNSTLLAPGSVILPGNWGRIILAIGQPHNLHAREMRLEQRRREQYIERPSRLTSAFYFERLHDALLYSITHDFGWQGMMILYEVELAIPNLPTHRGNHQLLPRDPTEQQIDEYWSGMAAPPSQGPAVAIETLSESPLRVLNRLAIDPSMFVLAGPTSPSPE